MEKINEKKTKVMNYLLQKVKEGNKVPSLFDMSKELDMNYSHLSKVLKKLYDDGRIEYKRGRVLKVNAENVKGYVVPKIVEQHKNKYSVKEFEEKYNQAVKEVICDYVKGIDSSAFSDSSNINKIIYNVTFITNKLKVKLFNE